MTKKPPKTDLAQRVMQKINSGDIEMRPRLYYTLVTLASVSVSLLAGTTLAYLMSIISFWVRIRQASGLAFGARRNLEILAGNFPWWAVLLSLLATGFLMLFIRRFGRLYRLSWQFVLAGIITLAVLIGFLLSYTSLPQFGRHSMRYWHCDPISLECQPERMHLNY